MNKTYIKQSLIVVSALSACLLGCGKFSASPSNSLTSSSSSSEAGVASVVESMVGAISSATNDSEQVNHLAALEKSKFTLIQNAYAADETCSLARFSPAINPGSNCNATAGGKTVNANFNRCLSGTKQEYRLEGIVKLEFDSNATCNTWVSGNLPTSGSITRTVTSGFKQIPLANISDPTIVSTESLLNYKKIPYGGGIITTFQNDRKIISILGMHRNNENSFSHTLHTSVPLIVSGTRASNNRKIESGTLLVDHNNAKYTTTSNISNIEYVNNCCYPVLGTMDIEFSSESKIWNGQKQKVFFNTGTCGKVDIADNDGKITRHTLSACY